MRDDNAFDAMVAAFNNALDFSSAQFLDQRRAGRCVGCKDALRAQSRVFCHLSLRREQRNNVGSCKRFGIKSAITIGVGYAVRDKILEIE